MWINPWIQSSMPYPIITLGQCRVPRILRKVNQLPTLIFVVYTRSAKWLTPLKNLSPIILKDLQRLRAIVVELMTDSHGLQNQS